MSNNLYKSIFLFIVMLFAGQSLLCQIEGESKAKSYTMLKKSRPEPEILSPDPGAIKKLDAVLSGDKNHALLIGVDNYLDPTLFDLDNPISDATLLYNTLTGDYFFEKENVVLLKDATRAQIIDELDRLSSRLTKKDNLIIFYAGHGLWDPDKETGYWLPSDADKSSSANWLRNSTIQDFIDDIHTRHTLLISDACFAGSIFVKSREGFRDASKAIRKLYSINSRKAMTSGILEAVPDTSTFMEYLLKSLNENEKKYISARDIFNGLWETVMNNSPTTPRYGVIQNTGDEGGEFIFIKR